MFWKGRGHEGGAGVKFGGRVSVFDAMPGSTNPHKRPGGRFGGVHGVLRGGVWGERGGRGFVVMHLEVPLLEQSLLDRVHFGGGVRGGWFWGGECSRCCKHLPRTAFEAIGGVGFPKGRGDRGSGCFEGGSTAESSSPHRWPGWGGARGRGDEGGHRARIIVAGMGEGSLWHACNADKDATPVEIGPGY